MILKRIFIIISVCFTLSFLCIPVFAETSVDDISHGGSDHGGGGSSGNRDETNSNSETSVGDISHGGSNHGGGGSGGNRDETNSNDNDISIPFTFLGNTYNFVFPVPAKSMQIVRDIVFYLLLAKSLFSKFKALPSIIGAIPSIFPSDSQHIYGK